jgi:2-hydroxy-6-oxonona-2,4-dienedioate hydrolase
MLAGWEASAGRRGIDSVALHSIWTDVGGLRIHSRAALDAPGDAPVVVLVHGFIISSRYMVPLAEHLAPWFRVYAPDLPGFGLSESPREFLGVRELADSLAAWMDAAALPAIHLLGNSFGCQVIADLASRDPRRASRIVLVGPTIDPHHRSGIQQIARLQVNTGREDPSIIPLHVPDYFHAGPRRIFRTYRAMMDDRIESKLPRVTAPTLVVRGSRDPIVPRGWAEEAAGLLPRGWFEEIPDFSHALNYSAPGPLARIVRPFLETPLAGAAGSSSHHEA